MKSLSVRLGVILVIGLIFGYAEVWVSHGAEDYLALCKEIIKRE